MQDQPTATTTARSFRTSPAAGSSMAQTSSGWPISPISRSRPASSIWRQILDAWSRRVVGYAISRSIDARITVAALTAAEQGSRRRGASTTPTAVRNMCSAMVLSSGLGRGPPSDRIRTRLQFFDLLRNGGDFARRFVHESPQLKLDVAIGAGEIRIDRERPGARRALQQAGWDSSIPRRAVRGCG
jgi:hypothetical protein